MTWINAPTAILLLDYEPRPSCCGARLIPPNDLGHQKGWWPSFMPNASLRQTMINLTYEDREELIIAAITGAVIGFFGGYYLDHSRGFGLLIWAIACAVIVSGMVYYLRAFRRR